MAVATAWAGGFPYAVHSQVLPNGLAVHVVPTPTPGAATVVTWMAVGSRDEVDAGRTGFAHFFEHLWFYGAETLSGPARERAVVRLGAEENAWTWFDETVYHMTVAADRVPQALTLQADVFRGLTLTDEQVRKESGAVYGEFRKGLANPDGRLWEALHDLAFDVHTYGHDTIGWEADIKAMPDALDYARTFFSRHYRPERATVIVAGDVQPDAVFAAVAERFGPWERGAGPAVAPPAEPPQKAARRTEVAWPNATAPRVAIGWRIPGHDNDDASLAALQVAADLWSSPVGPLQQRLVVDEGLAYSVEVMREDFVDPSLFVIAVTAVDDAAVPRIEAILREERDLMAQGPAAETLEATRRHVSAALRTSLDTPDEAASALGWALRRDPDPTGLDRWAALVQAVTPDAVAKAVQRHLVPATENVVILRHAP